MVKDCGSLGEWRWTRAGVWQGGEYLIIGQPELVPVQMLVPLADELEATVGRRPPAPQWDFWIQNGFGRKWWRLLGQCKQPTFKCTPQAFCISLGFLTNKKSEREMNCLYS